MSALVERTQRIQRVQRSAITSSLLVGLALTPACKKREATAPMDSQADAGATANAPDDPLAKLEFLEAKLHELGVQPARFAAPAGKRGEGDDLDTVTEESAEQASAPAEPQPESSAASVGRDKSAGGEKASALDDEDRCALVCDLNGTICELEVRICSMAKDHGDDPIYVDACERAVDDCELSGTACDACQ